MSDPWAEAHKRSWTEGEMTDDEFEAAVLADIPYFKRLNPILRAQGFTVAAWLTEHQRHQLQGEIHSDCDGCQR